MNNFEFLFNNTNFSPEKVVKKYTILKDFLKKKKKEI